MRFGLLSRPRVRRALGLHSPSLAMFGQCGCRHVCRGVMFDAAAIMRDGFNGAMAAVAPAARAAALRLADEAQVHAPVPAGALRASVAGETLPGLLDRIDALVAEDQADRWPTSWTWGPPSEAAFDRWS